MNKVTPPQYPTPFPQPTIKELLNNWTHYFEQRRIADEINALGLVESTLKELLDIEEKTGIEFNDDQKLMAVMTNYKRIKEKEQK